MQNAYSNRDFYLSAYLICKGCTLIKHIRDGGATTFTFHNSKDLQKLVDDFYQMKGFIDALSYSGAVRNLKTIIHSNRTAHQLSTSDTEDLTNGFNNKLKGKS